MLDIVIFAYAIVFVFLVALMFQEWHEHCATIFHCRIARERKASSYQSGLMQSVAGIFAGGIKERREICVVVKADVQGSAEALARSLTDLKLEDEESEVVIKVLISEAGDVTKSDIAVASVTPDTTVIAFNTGANAAAMDEARVLGVPIEYYSVV